jgi:dTDP-4-dehydrorhamnose 3,5-epimerase
MEFIRTDIPEVVIVEPTIFGDSRGYFMESFRRDLFCQNVEVIDFLQDNESKSSQGTLRGLHYQLPPYAQSKLVRVVTGRVLDVAVDLRRSSRFFGTYVATELSGENKRQLFIPKGFAHGFVVLSEEAVFAYKVDALYSPGHERGIFSADPELAVDWRLPLSKISLSDKDANLPCLRDAEVFA